MTVQKRREARYPARVPVILVRGAEASEVYTEDVSFRGLFLRTYAPPAPREVVQVRLTLPIAGASTDVLLQATAVHVVRPDNPHSRAPGVGLELCTEDGHQRARWERFVRDVRRVAQDRSTPVVMEDLIALQRADASDLEAEPEADEASAERPPRSTFPIGARYRLRVRTVEQLRRLHTENVARGGLFLSTPDEIALGTRVQVTIMHPLDGSAFPFHGVVRGHEYREDGRGLLVELDTLNDARVTEFAAFAARGASQLRGPNAG